MKDGLTGDTGEVGDGVDGATKRNAGIFVGFVGAEGSLVTRRADWCAFGREKLVVEVERSIGARVETVEFERVIVDVEVFKVVGSWMGLSAWAHGVVQMLFECPQA